MRPFSERSMNLIKLYKWNSIFFKYFKKSVIYILLPLIILSLAVFSIMIRGEISELTDIRSRGFQQISTSLESIFEDIGNNHTILSNASGIYDYCLVSDNEDSARKNKATLSAKHLLSNTSISSNYITDVHLYSPYSQYVLSTANSNHIEDFHLKDWYERYSKTGISDFVSYNDSDISGTTNDSVIISRGLFKSNHLYGIVIYETDTIVLNSILSGTAYENDEYMIYDFNGNIFYSNKTDLINKNINDVFRDINIESIDDIYSSHNMMIFKTSVNYTHKLILKADTNAPKRLVRALILIISMIIIVLIVSFVLSFYLSLQFYQSIIQITAALRNDEEYAVEGISEEKYSELYYINTHIISRLTQKDDVEEALAKQVTALKKAQLIALQTQINPHFIYNTLNLINTMVMNLAKRECDASRAIIILSQLLREAFDTKKYIVTLKDELEYIEKYITLQQFKFNYNVNIGMDIDENLLTQKVIKFMLQPIVENAFEHGFVAAEEHEYKLMISAKREDNSMVISVTNNGSAIEEDELSNLREKLLSDEIFEKKSIGLVNVNQRIRLIYGENYGCRIESDESSTTTRIKLPYNAFIAREQ